MTEIETNKLTLPLTEHASVIFDMNHHGLRFAYANSDAVNYIAIFNSKGEQVWRKGLSDPMWAECLKSLSNFLVKQWATGGVL